MSSPFPAASACPRESCKASRLKHVMQKTSALVCVHHMSFRSPCHPGRACVATSTRSKLQHILNAATFLYAEWRHIAHK